MPNLPNKQIMPECGLKLLKERFLQDAKLFEKCKVTIPDYINKGHAKRVPENEHDAGDELLWQLLHHPVFNPNKSGKMRVSSSVLQSLEACLKMDNSSVDQI